MTNAAAIMMLRALLIASLAVLAGACNGASQQPVQADAGLVTVYCKTLIDGLNEQPKTDQTITIAGDRISAITPGAPATDDYIDLSEHTCLPGLIDTHTHVVESGNTADLSVFYTRSLEDEQVIAAENARITLAAGFTTVRDVGSYNGWAARVLKERIMSGEIEGPRMQVAGFYLTIPGGGGDLVIPGHAEKDIPARIRMGVARGPEQFRQKAREAVEGGADVLKAIGSGAVLAFGGVPGAPEMTRDELRAVAEVAHEAGIKLTVHAHGAASIKDAILAGADSIEHASLADDEAIAMAAERGVFFSMDVYNADHIATVGRQEGWPEEFLRKNDETAEAQRQVFTKAHAAGVPITFGTDSAVYPHGDNAKQFAIMVERGMTPMEAIKAATSVAAKSLGWSDDVGALEPGRYADIIAVRGDPLADISVLESVDVVLKGGRRYK